MSAVPVPQVQASPATVAGVRRIAVLRANAIGDFVFALPALEALRAAYPAAEIVLLGKAWHATFLRGRAGPVDRVHVLPAVPGLTTAMASDDTARARALAPLRAAGFDLALQWHGGGRYSNPFVRALGARVTAGLRADDASPLDRNLPYVRWQNERARLMEAAALVGALPAHEQTRLALTDDDRREAGSLLQNVTAPLAVLQPGATDARRRWPAAHFAAAGDALAADGLAVAVQGSADEAALVQAVVRGMRAPATAVLPSLRGLAGVLARAAVVIGNDTGPLHLAHALGVPTVGLYWCGNVSVSMPLTVARHQAAIAWRLDCPVCGARNVQTRCAHDESFVADVTVAQVHAAARALLA